jgi:hypothetical protein
MAELKTQKTSASALDFINAIQDEKKRADSLILLDLFKKVTKMEPVMWGTSIIGFGQYHYKSERSTQEGDWPLVGFSPRKQNLTLYVMPSNEEVQKTLKGLGKFTTSVGCLYIKKLDDVDKSILKDVVSTSYEAMKKLHKA